MWGKINGGSNKTGCGKIANKISYKLLRTTEGGRAQFLINTIDASVSMSCPPPDRATSVPESKTQWWIRMLTDRNMMTTVPSFQHRGQIMLRGGLAGQLNGVASGQRESLLRSINVRCATVGFRQFIRVITALSVVCGLVVRTWGNMYAVEGKLSLSDIATDQYAKRAA
jgi:hypothetical protein